MSYIFSKGNGHMVVGDSADDLIQVVGNGNLIISGNGDDIVQVFGNRNAVLAGNGDNIIQVHGSNDLTLVGDGDNIIQMEGRGNWVVAGTGDNTIQVSGRDNMIFADGGSNTIFARGDHNTIRAMAAAGKSDTVLAHGQNDTVSVSSGFVIADGHSDRVNIADGHATVFARGGGDTIQVSGATLGTVLTIGGTGNAVFLSDNGSATMSLAHVGAKVTVEDSGGKYAGFAEIIDLGANKVDIHQIIGLTNYAQVNAHLTHVAAGWSLPTFGGGDILFVGPKPTAANFSFA